MSGVKLFYSWGSRHKAKWKKWWSSGFIAGCCCSVFYMVESVVVSELLVQLYIQALVPLLHSLGLVVSLGSPLGTCLTPRNHRVGKHSFCHSPGDLTSAKWYFSIFAFDFSSFQPGHVWVFFASYSVVEPTHNWPQHFFALQNSFESWGDARVNSGSVCGHPERFHALCSSVPLSDEQEPAFFP